MTPLPIAFDSQQWIPWKEPVTVTSVRPNTANVIVPDVHAGVYQQGTAENAPSRGVALAADIVVTIGLDSVTFEPLPWDQVLWRGRVYTVQRMNRSNWLRFYTLNCRDLRISGRLEQTGSILRAVDDVDNEGKRIPTPGTWMDNIPCRVQPITGQVGENQGALTTKATYRAYMGQQVYPQADDVFAIGEQRWSIVGWGDAELLDKLPYLDLVDLDQGTP